MLLADKPNIREIVAFPMNQQAEDLLMGAPAPVSDTRLRELHLKLGPEAITAVQEEQRQSDAEATLVAPPREAEADRSPTDG